MTLSVTRKPYKNGWGCSFDAIHDLYTSFGATLASSRESRIERVKRIQAHIAAYPGKPMQQSAEVAA